jgi:rod shape-determining protein MreD
MAEWLIILGIGALSVIMNPLLAPFPWLEARPYLPVLVVGYAAVRFPLVLSFLLAALVGALWDVTTSPYFGTNFYLCIFLCFFLSLQAAALGKTRALGFFVLAVGGTFLYFVGGYLFYLWRHSVWRWSMQVLYRAAETALLTGILAPLVLLAFDFLIFHGPSLWKPPERSVGERIGEEHGDQSTPGEAS